MIRRFRSVRYILNPQLAFNAVSSNFAIYVEMKEVLKTIS